MRVEAKDIENFLTLYAQLGTYAAVARETGFSAATVKKYIVAGANKIEKVEKKEIIHFNKEIANVVELKENFSLSGICELSEEEKNDIKEFLEELK